MSYDPTIIPLVWMLGIISVGVAIQGLRCTLREARSPTHNQEWFDVYKAVTMGLCISAMGAGTFIVLPHQYLPSLSRATATLWLVFLFTAGAFFSMRLRSYKGLRIALALLAMSGVASAQTATPTRTPTIAADHEYTFDAVSGDMLTVSRTCTTWCPMTGCTTTVSSTPPYVGERSQSGGNFINSSIFVRWDTGSTLAMQQVQASEVRVTLPTPSPDPVVVTDMPDGNYYGLLALDWFAPTGWPAVENWWGCLPEGDWPNPHFAAETYPIFSVDLGFGIYYLRQGNNYFPLTESLTQINTGSGDGYTKIRSDPHPNCANPSACALSDPTPAGINKLLTTGWQLHVWSIDVTPTITPTPTLTPTLTPTQVVGCCQIHGYCSVSTTTECTTSADCPGGETCSMDGFGGATCLDTLVGAGPITSQADCQAVLDFFFGPGGAIANYFNGATNCDPEGQAGGVCAAVSTATPTPTNTSAASMTPTRTHTQTPTNTATSTATQTPTRTITTTATRTITPTVTPTQTQTQTPTATLRSLTVADACVIVTGIKDAVCTWSQTGSFP